MLETLQDLEMHGENFVLEISRLTTGLYVQMSAS